MQNVVAVHNGTIQKMDRDKVITGGKVQSGKSSKGDTSYQQYRTRTRQVVHLVATCLQPWN